MNETRREALAAQAPAHLRDLSAPSKNKYGRIYRDAGADRPRAACRGRPGGEHAQGCPVPREPETSHPRANRASRRRKRASPGIYTYLANFDILIMLESKRRTWKSRKSS